MACERKKTGNEEGCRLLQVKSVLVCGDGSDAELAPQLVVIWRGMLKHVGHFEAVNRTVRGLTTQYYL
jgi:hypothetical protein